MFDEREIKRETYDDQIMYKLNRVIQMRTFRITLSSFLKNCCLVRGKCTVKVYMRISAQKDAAWRIGARQNVWRHNLMLPDSTNLCVYPHGIGRSCCIPHDFVWLQALNPADLQIQNRADIGTEWCSSTEDYAIYRTL